LQTEDLDTKDALKLLQGDNLEKLGLTVGQKRGLEAALRKLKHETKVEGKLSDMTSSEPVTTKSLAKDGGLDEILKKIEGAGSLEDSLLALASTEPFMKPSTDSSCLSRLANDPHVFLGPQHNAANKEGEKPLLIPDFVSLGTYDSNKDEQEIGNVGGGAKLVLCAAKGKPKLESITLSQRVTANSCIMHELLRTGQLSTNTSDIADFLAYTVNFAELLESHTRFGPCL